MFVVQPFKSLIPCFHPLNRYPAKMSGQILQEQAESWKSCIRVAYLPIAVYTMNLKDKLLGFHHCPWALAVATRKSASNFKTRNKAALDTWEHVDYGVGQCPTWAMKP